MTLAEIFIPKEKIDYSKNSVERKTFIKNPAGNITLFAFDKGVGLSEHSSPHEALIQVIDGKAEIIISGNTNIMLAGHCIILPGNIPHSVKAIEKFKMMLTMIKS